MRGKLLFVVGLATGYVLGSRAGRQRYEQIKAGADKVWNLAPVQQGVRVVQDFAGERVDALQQKLVRGAKKAVSSLLNLDDSGSKPSRSTPSGTRSAPATRSTAKPASKAAAGTARRPAAKTTPKAASKAKTAAAKRSTTSTDAPASDTDE